MRPEGRGEFDSLYFTYPHFACTPAPEQQGVHALNPVVIIGAGPIGLTAALTLAKYGIKSRIFEQKQTLNDGSRAICIARASFHIFQQLGVVTPFLEKSLGWTRGRSYYKNNEFFRFAMPHSPHEKYLPMYNLQQQYTEDFLVKAALASPLIEIHWGHGLSGISQNNDEATLTISTANGDYTSRAAYVLAADGARSITRKLMDLRLKGENFEGRYIIADIQMAHDFPTERRAFFAPKANPGGTVLIHKQPDNIWRIDYQLKEGEDEAAALREDAIRARVGAILEEIGHQSGFDLEWWSVYSANTLALDEYSHGRVYFIGDSAHIVPIFGVRGLNNGLADAQNIGWKLAYLLKGRAGAGLLTSYSPERRGATMDVFLNAKKSTRFMTPPSHGYHLMRAAVLSLALREDFAKEFANPRQMQPYTYAQSPLTQSEDEAAFWGAPPLGGAAPNAQLAAGDYLFDRFGAGFIALNFGAENAKTRAVLMKLQALDPDFTWLNLSAETVEVQARFGIDSTTDKGAGGLYLLRPDWHIAARWQGDAGLDKINDALQGILRGA